ncbi:hypothetical protein GCM10027421_36420 [Microbacterium shaanxiense]
MHPSEHTMTRIAVDSFMPTRRLVRAEAAVRLALRDFEWVGRPAAPVRLVGVQEQKAVVAIGADSYALPMTTAAELVVATVEHVQRSEAEGGRCWPDLPAIGVLKPALAYGDALWVTPDGGPFCPIGRLFFGASDDA